MPEVKKPRYFYSYLAVMADLKISRRTLQRWIDDMEIDPLEFEDQMRVFLTLPNLERLREYGKIMRTRDQVLINRYRQAIQTGNNALLARLRKDIANDSIA